MRVTVIKDDGVVGVDGVFRAVDLSAMEVGVRAIQWDGSAGHKEFTDNIQPNADINTIAAVQSFIDLWNAAAPPAPPPPTASELIAFAHSRINAAYSAAVAALTSGYPQNEIDSWPKQEQEARAWTADNAVATPWIDSAAASRGIVKADFVALVIANADALAPLHGALTGKRQKLRDQIDALGSSPTQAQLDSIIW